MPHDQPDDRYPAESEIECPRCGEIFYYELNRCPNCGLDVYADDDEDPDDAYADPDWGIDPQRDSLEEWLAMFTPAAAIFAGLFLCFVVSTVVFIVLRSFFGDLAATLPGRALQLAGVPLGAAAGGFSAAALEGNRPRRMGWWVGGLSIIAAVVLAGVDRNFTAGSWVALDTLPILVITVLSGAAGGEFWRRKQRDEVVRRLFPADLPDEESLYEDLMAMTGHDPDLAERLIEHERFYMPNANRRTLIESAIRRLARDRR
jgi:hypothetical protein